MEISDKVLGQAADIADRATGGKAAGQVNGMRSTLDEKIGNESDALIRRQAPFGVYRYIARVGVRTPLSRTVMEER
ncbi:hypothetical protein GCM10025768_01220 [Microbacterium pseudoresistens]|uniref:Uncharacterized protein n=1 Tax=Microbacterium pseudoresistens TaxID=640634 RepID=A0A7Y9EU09_9MICO|nr:antitoxin [Microbacterium pseudoresistens]NYD53957.1 hypothetical protein [Microbacterium pseudoresistens]